MSQFAFAIGVSQKWVPKWNPHYEENVLSTLKALGIRAKPWCVNASVIQAWWDEEGRIIDPEYVSKKVRALSKVIPESHICQLSLAVPGLLGDNHPLYNLSGAQLYIHPMGKAIDETHVWATIHKIDEKFPVVISEFQRVAEQITLLATLQKVIKEGRDLQVHKKNLSAAEAKWDKVLKLSNEMASRLVPRIPFPRI